MIKVCHLLEELSVGGLENTAKQIVLHLDNNQYRQEVWCVKGKGLSAGEYEQKGIVVRPFDFEGGLNLRALRELVGALRSEKFDIIHAHGFFPFIWGVAAGTLAGIPVRVVHCQSTYYGVALWQVTKLRILSVFAARVIAVSEAVRRSLIEYVRIPPSKITVIYNAAPDLKREDREGRIKKRRELGIDEDDYVVGSVGRLLEHKGHRYVIEAVARLRPRVPRLKYLIVGGGPGGDALRRRAADLAVSDIVIFAGKHNDAGGFYPLMDIYIQPSILKEGLPLALAEAASAGLPLIATDIGGNAEVAHNGVNGYIVEPENTEALAAKIELFVRDPDQMRRMGEGSRRVWRERFMLDTMIRDIDSLYRQLLGPP